MDSGKLENNNIIQVNNLTKEFDGLLAVDNISFNIKKGQIFAFLGPNGAGKTTTIKMLTTLLTPTSGKIVLNGYNPLEEKYEAPPLFWDCVSGSKLR